MKKERQFDYTAGILLLFVLNSSYQIIKTSSSFCFKTHKQKILFNFFVIYLNNNQTSLFESIIRNL